MKMSESNDPGFLDDRETQLTRLACPECGGVMAEISLPKITYFRCHVGHQFGPKVLAAAQAETSEKKLWNAVAALEEQAVVLRHLAEHMPAGGPGDQQAGEEEGTGYVRRAQKTARLADLIRDHLEGRHDAS
jgi:two-component system chemotaxis response regulator CheB